MSYLLLKTLWSNSLFKPTFISPFINPFFLIRTCLYYSIRRAAKNCHNGVLLDFGCGKKPYKNLFKVDKYIGIDIDSGAHKNQIDDVDIYFDGKSIPLADDSVDFVLSTEVFEHVFNLSEIMDEIKRVLKPGGQLIVTIPFFWEEHEIPFDFARYTSYGFNSIIQDKKFELVSKWKTGTESLVLCQLMINYFWKPSYKCFNFLALLILPFISVFFIVLFILPTLLEFVYVKNPKVYFNNVFILRKI
jgi:SAM-dependent methyltransferase